MKAHNYTFILVVIFIAAGSVQAVGDWDIYSDAVIEEGNIFSNVRVYDTPPDHTTVDMTGGMVDSMGAYLESTINVSGGNISTLSGHDYSEVNVSGGFVYGIHALGNSIVNFYDNAKATRLSAGSDFGIVNMTGGTVDLLGAGDSGVLNLYDGLISDSLGASGTSIVNIYGYDINYDPEGGTLDGGLLTGFWFNDSSFVINLYGEETYSHINLIPEPSSFVLLVLGGLIIKRKR